MVHDPDADRRRCELAALWLAEQGRVVPGDPDEPPHWAADVHPGRLTPDPGRDLRPA